MMWQRLRERLFWREIRLCARPQLCFFAWPALLLLLAGVLAVSSEYTSLKKWEQDAKPGQELAAYIASIPDRRKQAIDALHDKGLLSEPEYLAEQTRTAELTVICKEAEQMIRAQADAVGWDVVSRHAVDTYAQTVATLVGQNVIQPAADTRIGGRIVRWLGLGAVSDHLGDIASTIVSTWITVDGGTVSRATTPDWGAEWERVDAQLLQVLQLSQSDLLRARFKALVLTLERYCETDPQLYRDYLHSQAAYFDQQYNLSNEMMRKKGITPKRPSPWETTADFRAWLAMQVDCTPRQDDSLLSASGRLQFPGISEPQALEELGLESRITLRFPSAGGPVNGTAQINLPQIQAFEECPGGSISMALDLEGSYDPSTGLMGGTCAGSGTFTEFWPKTDGEGCEEYVQTTAIDGSWLAERAGDSVVGEVEIATEDGSLGTLASFDLPVK